MEEIAIDSGMITFRYRAIELATGRVREGEQGGPSAYAVRASLRRIGLQVESIEPVGQSWRAPEWAVPLVQAWQARMRRGRRMQRADLFDAVATLINAGLPLEQAIGNLAASPARPAAERRLLARLRDHLREGHPLSEACRDFPDWFDPLDFAMLSTGQKAGDLPGVLTTLSEFHQRGGDIGQKLFVALAYPAMLFAAGLAAVIFLSLVPLPKLLALITQSRHEPPWLTAHMVAFGQIVAHWWPVILVALIAACIGIAAVVRRIPMHGFLGRIVHHNLVAKARRRAHIAALSFTLARLRRSGMPLLEAVEAAAETAESAAMRAMLHDAAHAIRRGEDLSRVVGDSALMEPEFAQLLHLGERSGELTMLLERIAERYERTAQRTIERVATLLGPIAIVILAMLIAVVALAAVLPIVQLGDLL